MPANMAGDFLLNGKPFMLWRDPKGGSRSWKRERVPDTLSNTRRLYRSIAQPEVYGGLPDELDHPEVWDDWSGGYGTYRKRDAPNHFHSACHVDTRFPGAVTLAQRPRFMTIGNPVANVDYMIDTPNGQDTPFIGTGRVFVAGTGVFEVLSPTQYPYTSGSAFTASTFATAGSFGHRPAVFGSYIYVPRLDTGNFWQVDWGNLNPAEGPLPARWFVVSSGRLWKGAVNTSGSGGAFLVQSCPIGADPMTASNWGATIAIGNGQMVSEDAIALEDHIFVAFPDGLYMGDQSGTFSNVAADVLGDINQDSVRDLAVHNGRVVFASGRHVWAFKPSSGANSELLEISPTVDARPLGSLYGSATLDQGSLPMNGLNVRGPVLALHGAGRWLYAGVFTGSASVIYAGAENSPGLPYVWHPMQVLPACKVRRIHIDRIVSTNGGVPIPQRMWVATEATFGANPGCTAPLYWWPIPADNDAPYSDPSFSPNYYPFGIVEQSLTDSEVPNTWKLWRKFETWYEGLGASVSGDVAASTYLNIYAYLDATMTATFDSMIYVNKPKDFHYFQNVNNDAVGQSALVAIRLNSGFSANGTGATTPLLRTVVGHNAFRPRIAEQITVKVRIADRIQDRFGNEMRPGATQLDELDTMSRSSNPYPLTDLVGRTYPVVVLPGVDEEEAYQGADDYPEVMATVKLGVIDASWNAAPTVPFHPDGG